MDYMLIEINECRRLKETAEKYYMLLMVVEEKYESETRHETALRYIKAGAGILKQEEMCSKKERLLKL